MNNNETWMMDESGTKVNAECGHLIDLEKRGAMKLFPKIESWFSADEAATKFTYTIPDRDFLRKELLIDLFHHMNKRISSYMARRYIEKNRERIDRFVKHAVVRRHIEREIRNLLDMK